MPPLPDASAASTGPEIPSTGWPQRRHYGWLAVFFMALALYGSLIPLEFRPMSWSAAIEQFCTILRQTIWRGSRTDWVNNYLLFMPIGYFLLAAVALDRSRWLVALVTIPLVLAVSAAFSTSLEFAQVFLPDRVPSGSDILAQTFGTTVGMAVWLLTGQAITQWLRSHRLAQRPRDQVDWLLQAYFLGYLIYSILPLDLTLSPSGLVHKYRGGRILLVPFTDVGLNFETFYSLFRDVAVAVPIGMLAATWLTSPRWPVRSILRSLLLGGTVVVGVEVAQLFLQSRTAATADVITGMLGVALGAWTMRRRRPAGSADPPGMPASAWRGWKWLGAAAVYAMLLVYIFCGPLQSISAPPDLRARFDGFFELPFAAFYHGTLFNAISEVLRKGLFFAPLGAMLALAAGSFSIPASIRRILLAILLLAAAGLATSIEMLQIFLPRHVPALGDVILCTLGTAAGMWVTLQIVGMRRAAD